MQESTPEAGVEVKSNVLSSSSVELEEIAGQRLFVEFEAFGFYNRTCQLELQPDGDLIFSKGMITSENGAWRVEVRRAHLVRRVCFSELWRNEDTRKTKFVSDRSNLVSQIWRIAHGNTGTIYSSSC